MCELPELDIRGVIHVADHPPSALTNTKVEKCGFEQNLGIARQSVAVANFCLHGFKLVLKVAGAQDILPGRTKH